MRVLQGYRLVVRLPQLGYQGSTACLNSYQLQRVASLPKSSQSPGLFDFLLRNSSAKPIACRTYATKPVSRPKAHTGRTTAKPRKAPTTSKTKAAKKPAAKKTSPKAKPKAKSTAKPRSKPKRKAAKKTKAKPKPKRKVLTEAEKNARTIRDLKATALKPPTGVPGSAWQVLLTEKQRDKQSPERGFNERVKSASAEFKGLSPERLEHYNHIANQNKAANQKAYRQWIESHTPAVIHLANVARKNLRRRGLKGYYLLQDDRLVKRNNSSFSIFFQQRYSTGDFKGLKASEAAKLASREWKALSASEKKPYEDSAQQDLARYTQEAKTVYNKDVRRKPRAAAAA
ncbi:hypothetical protein ACLMJK_003922 [Lecanora helva]